MSHAIEVEGGGAGGKDAKSTTISPGQSTTLTVDLKPGQSYQWYCPIDNHKNMGMKGEIKVAGAKSASSSTPKSAASGTSSSSSSSGSSGGSSGGSGGGSSSGY